MKRREFLKVIGLGACGMGLSGCVESQKKAANSLEDPPNILWITCEDISPALGCYGDQLAITPNLDKFAAEGALYEQAFSTAPVCAPGRACLVTGVYATSLGAQHLRSAIKLPESIKCFPQYLMDAGYYCSNNYKEDYNFDSTGVWHESSHEAHWRKRTGDQPFFSVFNIVATHQGQINGTDEQFNEKYRSHLTEDERHDPADIVLPPYYPDTPLIRDIWARYYDLITYMDKEVGKLLADLEADGLAENTIVFFFSDHGFGMPRCKRTLYDSGLHVPLLVRFPGKWRHLCPVAPGGRTDRLVSFVDFAPTVLSLVGLEAPDHMQGTAFLGHSIGRPSQYVFGASSRVDEVYEMSRSVRNRRYKYIRNYMPHLGYIQPSEFPDRAEIMHELRRVLAEGKMSPLQSDFWRPSKPVEELYDTLYDPDELNNLVDSLPHKPVLERLRSVLADWMIETCDTGLMSEAEMHIRSEGSTPYETAHDSSKFPVKRVLRSADLVGTGPQSLPKIQKLLKDADSAVRYWAVIALDAMDSRAQALSADLTSLLTDQSPNVRFAAAGVLCRLGMCDQALPVLADGLDERREETVLYAARELERIGDRACAVADKMRAAQARCKTPAGAYKNNNHAMFIDWALKYALANCSQ